MRGFKMFTLQLCVAISVMIFGLVGCSDPSYELGNSFLPDGSQMATGSMDFSGGVDDNGDRVISTRYYYTDRINSAMQTTAMFGAQFEENFGKRFSGFYSQYVPMYAVDEDNEFGYEPILDSVVFYYLISRYAGDTTRVTKFNVYEVLNDDFLGGYDITDEDDYLEKNSNTAISEFAEAGVLSDVLFSFNFPDQDNGIYLTSTSSRAYDITEAGYDLLDRLMLKSGDYDSEIYNSGEYADFIDAFKGLYITPDIDTDLDVTSASDGATYGTTYSSTGFGLFGRSKVENDPTLIKDTIGMVYTFKDDDIDVSGVSINATLRDYSVGKFSAADVKTEDNPTVESNGVIAVEGMGGLVNELTFEQSLFTKLEEQIAADEEGYNNIFFNTVRLTIYNPYSEGYGIYTQDSSVDYTLDDMPTRLALYSCYSTYYDDDGDFETGLIYDYDYTSEIYYGTVSSMDGSLSRSRGCYTIYMTLHMQVLWNDYVDAKEENGGESFTQSEWDAMDWNKLYLAPLLSDLYTAKYAILQGQADGVNKSPIRLELDYTLLKK